MHKALLPLIWIALTGWGNLASASTASTASTCEALRDWPAWTDTQQRMISAQGRVIDHSDPRLITTSEGQSYAMFFALVHNDRELFRRLVQWTQDNLANGDLSSNLPAWLWGRKPDEQWDVLDPNSASDSDLWIAYSLLEAGRLWKERGYTTMGNQLLAQIATREVVDLPGFGPMMLPASIGFVETGYWRLNPSYLPPQLTQRAAIERNKPWHDVNQNTPRFLIETAPKGISPDWISWTDQRRFEPTDERQTIGSYDAIRVYLWIGMLAKDAPQAAQLRSHFERMGEFVNAQGQVAEKIDVATATATSWAGPGFSAALLPLMSGREVQTRLLANVERGLESRMGYYNQMLTLFGHGWFESRYRFNADGRLEPAWVDCR